MTLYCAIELHSNNNVPVVLDENDQILDSVIILFYSDVTTTTSK